MRAERSGDMMVGMQTDEQAVDIKTMAQMLNVSTATLYSLIRRGEVPAMQIGSLWRMFPSKVIARFEAVAVEDSTPTPGSWKQSPRSAAAHKAAETRRRLAAERSKREQG